MHAADHGTQSTSWAFGQRLRSTSLLGSMGTGDAMDNTVAERFVATLQAELLDRHHWATRRELTQAGELHIAVAQLPEPVPELEHTTRSRHVHDEPGPHILLPRHRRYMGSFGDEAETHHPWSGWSGRGDLNPRPPAPKAGALPLRYSPDSLVPVDGRET